MAFVMLALKVSILCTVFGIGLKTTAGDLAYPLRRPGLLARSLFSVLVLVPLVAILLVRLFDFRHTLEVALVALAISPVPPLLPKREGRAGGHHAYGIGLMALLAILAIVTVPLWAEILQRVFSSELAASSTAVAKTVVMSTLLPLAAGMLVRAAAPAFADRIADPIGLTGNVLLPVAALALLAATSRALLATFGDGTAIALIVFVAVALAIGHVLGGPDPDHSVVLALSSACRHPAIAVSIASANFADAHVGATVLFYVIVNTLVGLAYLKWRRRHVVALAST
jgi:BASS family bile acid:Na+ symporter